MLKVNIFDEVTHLDPKVIEKVELPDLFKADDMEKQKLLANLSSEDLLWVTIAKIYSLFEMLADGENLPRVNEGLGLIETVINFFGSEKMVIGA